MSLLLFTLQACCRFKILAVEPMSMRQMNIIFEPSSIEARETLLHPELSQNCMI